MKFINLHTHKVSNTADVLEIINQYPTEFDSNAVHYSIGIHPWKIIEDQVDHELEIIEQKLQFSNCLAVGECGLDKRIEASIDLQTDVFIKQIHLAIKYNKPIIIHCVGAFQELIAVKNQFKISVPMIIHGFSKNEIVAKQLIDNGFYLSFGKYLPDNSNLKSVFQSVPNDKFFLETDSSNHAIESIYNVAAQFKSLDLLTLQNQVKSNFNLIFNL